LEAQWGLGRKKKNSKCGKREIADFGGRQLREDSFLEMSFLLGRLEGSRDFGSAGAERSDSFGCVLSLVHLCTRCGVLSIFGKWGFYINKIKKKSSL